MATLRGKVAWQLTQNIRPPTGLGEGIARFAMNEKVYTQTSVIPLLKHLGYAKVTYNHGIEEFGKDVLFSEYDRFGNKIYHAAQVKVGDIPYIQSVLPNKRFKLMD